MSSTSATGTSYRLRQAVFSVERGGFEAAELSSETDPDASVLTANLSEGSYTVGLQSGWAMERLVDGAYEPVPATLLTPTAQAFSIEEGVTTSVVYQFKVAGDLVTVGGSLAIEAEVIEEACQNDLAEPNDTAESAFSIQANTSYDATICSGDEDYFVLADLNNNSVRAQISFTHADGDLDIAVYDELGALVGTSESATDNEEVYIRVFAGTSAIIRVNGWQGASNDYTLSVDVGPADHSPPGWTCQPVWYADGDCDCGCGVFDVEDCESNIGTESCDFDLCEEGESADPSDNSQCIAAP